MYGAPFRIRTNFETKISQRLYTTTENSPRTTEKVAENSPRTTENSPRQKTAPAAKGDTEGLKVPAYRGAGDEGGTAPMAGGALEWAPPQVVAVAGAESNCSCCYWEKCYSEIMK